MKIVLQTYYLSDESNIPKTLKTLEMSKDELETVVGKFRKDSKRPGQLKGEVVEYIDQYVIRHHFTKKVLWSCYK